MEISASTLAKMLPMAGQLVPSTLPSSTSAIAVGASEDSVIFQTRVFGSTVPDSFDSFQG